MRWTALTALAALSRLTTAQIARYSPGDNISFRVNIPESTSSSGSGSVFIQISAPTSLQWVALGQGTGMAGANIFVIYQNGNGGVTVSPRSGRGYFQPQFNSNANIEVLDGSGVDGDTMVANIRCDSCIEWSGGDMSVTDTSSNWIWSYRNGNPLDSTSQSASIQQHDTHGEFTFDLTRATGGSSENPFVTTSNPSGSQTSGGAVPTSTNPSDNDNNNTGSDGDDDEDQGSTPTGGQGGSGNSAASTLQTRQKVHGILMGLAFAVLFPLGAIIMRVVPGQAKVNIHMVIQIVGYAIAVAGLAFGVLLGRDLQLLMDAHPIIGFVVVGGLFFQPIIGLVHHWLFLSRQKRTILAPLHVYWGRALIILGIINGGLGLRLANNTDSGKIAYAVVAGVMGAAWLGAVVWYYIRGGSKQNASVADKQYQSAGSNERYSE